jgi:gamma-glutamylcyclotransferase (GGCT)/AIG2-like uncharacterized protein YtfP
MGYRPKVAELTPAVREDEITNLFVYGTLVEPAQRHRVLGRSCPVVPAILKGYQRREGRYPYVVPVAGHSVPGRIMCQLGKEDFAKLDDYEVVNPVWCEGAMRRLYRRELTDALTRAGVAVRCWVFMPNLRDWPASWR